MIKIDNLIQRAKAEGYNEANAEAKVCQDIELKNRIDPRCYNRGTSSGVMRNCPPNQGGSSCV